MPGLTNSSCSDYSLISSLDAISITSSARPSSPAPHSRASVSTSTSSRRDGEQKLEGIDSDRQLIMPTTTSLSAIAQATDTQSGVAALTKASLATLTDIRQNPSPSLARAKMPITRSQSRATSEVPTSSSTSSIIHITPKPKGKKVKREISPSLLHSPKQEVVSLSIPPPLTPTDEDDISNQLSQLMVKVELMDSDEEAEMMDEVPELSDFGAMRLSQVPRIKTPGPGSVLSTEDAHSTIESFLNSRSSFISDKDNKLRLWQSICIELGLVAIKQEDDQTSSQPTNKNKKSRKRLPPVPTSLTTARNLLRERAHVNINQYLEARKKPVPAGQRRDLSGLLHGNLSALIEYTIKSKNFTPRKFAKDQWLQPLMRSIR